MQGNPQILGGWIYLLTNESMPGVVKIGMTTRCVDQRAKELSASTSAPSPFKVAHRWPVHDPAAVEAALHKKFQAYRVNQRREFFRVSAVQVVQTMPDIVDEHGGLRPLHRQKYMMVLLAIAGVALALVFILNWPGTMFGALGLFALVFGMSATDQCQRGKRGAKRSGRRATLMANRVIGSVVRSMTRYLLQGLLGKLKSRR